MQSQTWPRFHWNQDTQCGVNTLLASTEVTVIELVHGDDGLRTAPLCDVHDCYSTMTQAEQRNNILANSPETVFSGIKNTYPVDYDLLRPRAPS